MKDNWTGYVNIFISVVLTLLMFTLSSIKDELKTVQIALARHNDQQQQYEISTEKRLTGNEKDISALADMVMMCNKKLM
jgi:hypothetical protein